MESKETIERGAVAKYAQLASKLFRASQGFLDGRKKIIEVTPFHANLVQKML